MTLVESSTNNKNITTPSIVKKCCSISGIYIIWIILHHIAANLYAIYCTPITILGILTAPFIVATPHCTGLRWCINNGSDTMIAMWIAIGYWIKNKYEQNK